jgi:hypothetical protein
MQTPLSIFPPLEHSKKRIGKIKKFERGIKGESD